MVRSGEKFQMGRLSALVGSDCRIFAGRVERVLEQSFAKHLVRVDEVHALLSPDTIH